MIDGLRLEYTVFCMVLIGVLLIVACYMGFLRRPVVYRYSLASYIADKKSAYPFFVPFFFILRLFTLILLGFLVSRPQLPDKRTRVNVEGIDIMMLLDVSGSMICFDDLDDRKTRIETAKEEAQRFVDQRETDSVGLAVFGNGALSACPLTHDKTVLREIIQGLDLGTMIDDRSTMLAHGMLTALNRLKQDYPEQDYPEQTSPGQVSPGQVSPGQSNSPSKIMIVLTDGQPSMYDAPIELPLSIAKKLGIKIYTIGIGGEQGGYSAGPHGMLLSEGMQLNETLLQHIADQTGGAFYRARNAKEMRSIYSTIDRLEKRSIPVNLHTRYYDIFEPFLWLLLLLVVGEVLLSAFVWKTL